MEVHGNKRQPEKSCPRNLNEELLILSAFIQQHRLRSVLQTRIRHRTLRIETTRNVCTSGDAKS